MPQRVMNEDLLRNKPLDYSLTTDEENQLRALAKAVGVRYTAFIREAVMTADLSDETPITRRRCSPGSGGNRKAMCFRFAEREEVRFKAQDFGMTCSDYIYRALVKLLPAPAQVEFITAASDAPKAINFLTPPPANRIAALEADQLDLVIKIEKLTKEMNAIGVNINQLAHASHNGKVLPGLWQEARQKLDHRLAKADAVLTEVTSRYVSNHS